MNVKIINNKKGSALLWCILLIIILTILLGSIITASYAYYNYTVRAVRKQQAYFTARSAITTVIEKLSETTSDADGQSAILPDGGKIVTITDFGFPDTMGTAKAWIARGEVEDPKTQSLSTTEAQNYATILVEATYAGQTYSMKATIANQPVYFAGIAVDDLSFATGTSSSLTLGDNTDLYYKKAETFDMTKLGGKITVNGSLVAKGDIVVSTNATIAGHTFDRNVKFFKQLDTSTNKYDYSFSKKIWSASEYIISNKTLQYFEDSSNTEYSTTTIKTLRALVNGNADYIWCNNRSGKNILGIERTNYFGGLGLDDAVGSLVPSGSGLSNLLGDVASDGLGVTDSNGDALSVRYLKVQSNASFLGGLASDYLDIFYIGYSSTNSSSRADAVIPVTYLLVPDSTKTIWGGSKENAVTVRILFGSEPSKLSGLFSLVDGIEESVENTINKIFDRTNTPAYTIVYLGKGATLELGPDNNVKLAGKNVRSTYPNMKTDGSLIFPITIYGEEGSTVILHDGVTVLGEIIAPNLEVDGDVTVIYSNSSGSQVAKQRVDNYWSVCGFEG